LTEQPSKNESRKSALIVATVFGLLAVLSLRRGRLMRAEIMGGLSAALFITGLCVPPLARAFHRAWMTLAAALGFVNSRVLLTVIYLLVMTPFGWIRGVLGSDPLRRRGPGESSYWVPRTFERQPREQFERTF